ncbi:MAG: Yip1 family protein [Candidatus Micrarchaeota archaeon]|nr:Yip1 family protein [Candidatus Micrarchaeota archaeon]
MEFPDIRKFLDYKNLESYLTKLVQNASWNAILINVGLIVIITGIASLIAAFISTTFASTLAGMAGKGAMGAGLSGAGMTYSTAIFTIITNSIGFFILGGILQIIAKLFGGKGKIADLIYLMSIYGLAIAPVSALLTILSSIPFVSCIILPIVLLISLYGLYAQLYLPIKIVHKFDSKKAMMAVGAYVAIMVVISIIITIALVASRVYPILQSL